MSNWFPGMAGTRYATREQVRRYLEVTANAAVTDALALALSVLDADTIAALGLKANQADLLLLEDRVDDAEAEILLRATIASVAASLLLKTDLTVHNAHAGSTTNPHSVTATQVGLGNVDNTSDLDKPISTAVQAALDTKANHGYVDIDFPIIIRDTGPSRPVLEPIRGNLVAPQWDVGDWVQIEDQEVIHGWREASSIQWHAHILTAGTDVDDRYFALSVEWAWANALEQLSTEIITTSPDLLIPANTPDRTHIPFQIGLIDLPTMNKGAHIYARLTRVASVGTAPTNDIFCSMLQLHVDTDTYGLDDLPGST